MKRGNGSISLLFLAVAAGLESCAPPADESAGRAAGGHLTTNDPTPEIEPVCPDWMCNAATVGDGLVFDELAYSPKVALPNAAGIWISRAELWGRPVTVRVRGHDLIVKDGNGEAAGPSLGGLVLVVDHSNGASYLLRFERHSATKYWAGPAAEVPYHQIRVRKIRRGHDRFGNALGREVEPDFKHVLCAGTPDVAEGQEVSQMAVLFEGDRYNVKQKTVSEQTSPDEWFNVACAGTAMIKMHLLRHTRAGHAGSPAAASPTTTVPQRQALLKMLTADYCGDGRAHTINGHPLIFTDALGLFPRRPLDLEDLLSRGATIEAIWGSQGAVCLNDPRYVVREAVGCRAVLPYCGADLEPWTRRGHALSINPPRKF